MNETGPVERRLAELLEPLLDAMGYELVHLRQLEKNGVLRVYIDHLTEEGDITLEDCERVSHEVEAVLDVENPIPGRFRLEVSSPGLDRPLTREAHFERFRGYRARVVSQAPINGQRRFRGVIAGVSDGTLILEVDRTELRLPLEDIRTARLSPEV